ncbi:MAG TPA: hypothetical protein VM938_06750 [Acidimicrobiales bacterium]|nr:hypothetical protein [Acidimicrobiales bacterium]
MLLAELEIRHSRAIAPTRRIALGDLYLPVEPAPGFGGLLLAAIVGACTPKLDDESRDDIDRLLADLESGKRIVQPRLRHRFQTDTHGLDRSRHRLVGDGEAVDLEVDGHGAVLPQALGALYAAAKLSYRVRPDVFRMLRRATRWEGPGDARLLRYLSSDEAAFRPWRRPGDDEESWALTVLGFETGVEPARSEILRRFRSLVRDAHPDHGAAAEVAGARITDLTQAKRILLADA